MEFGESEVTAYDLAESRTRHLIYHADIVVNSDLRERRGPWLSAVFLIIIEPLRAVINGKISQLGKCCRADVVTECADIGNGLVTVLNDS